MKHETLLTSLLFITGKATGDELVSFYAGFISEPEMAEKMYYQLAQALARMYRDGHVSVTDYQDGRVWELDEESSRNWVNEVLVAKTGRPN